jgi:hypothetical protein
VVLGGFLFGLKLLMLVVASDLFPPFLSKDIYGALERYGTLERYFGALTD